jgi:peptidoglycan hydrolase-like protein with peptidoglycan-binding domain
MKDFSNIVNNIIGNTKTKEGLEITLQDPIIRKDLRKNKLGKCYFNDGRDAVTIKRMRIDTNLGSYKVNDALPFKKGQYSDYIKAIQSKLGIDVDGKFGNDTFKAVVKFQKSKGLPSQGIFGKLTWKALFGSEFPNT